MNESMRSSLQALGLGTNLSEGSLIWAELAKRATAGNHVRDALLPEDTSNCIAKRNQALHT